MDIAVDEFKESTVEFFYGNFHQFMCVLSLFFT
jgi:hypothetical protein